MSEKKVDEATMNTMGQMVGPAMRLMNELTKDIKSENAMSKFVEDNMGTLLCSESEMANGFLIKALMEEANKDPRAVLADFLNFYNEFRLFYTGLMNPETEGENVTDNPNEE